MMTPMYFPFKVLVILKNINHRITSKNLILQSACQSGVGGGGGWGGCSALFPGKKTVGTRLIIENFFFLISIPQM